MIRYILFFSNYLTDLQHVKLYLSTLTFLFVARNDMRDPNYTNNAHLFANLPVYSSFIRQNTNKTITDSSLNISILHVLSDLDE